MQQFRELLEQKDRELADLRARLSRALQGLALSESHVKGYATLLDACRKREGNVGSQ